MHLVCYGRTKETKCPGCHMVNGLNVRNWVRMKTGDMVHVYPKDLVASPNKRSHYLANLLHGEESGVPLKQIKLFILESDGDILTVRQQMEEFLNRVEPSGDDVRQIFRNQLINIIGNNRQRRSEKREREPEGRASSPQEDKYRSKRRIRNSR